MDPVGLFALGAAVLMISALLAGVIDRAPVSFPMIFLTLGLVLGGGTTGVAEVSLDDDALRTVAFATLALVLFLEAMSLDLRHLRRYWVVPALTLGPGTLLVIALTALAAVVIVDLDPVIAFLLAAILASTDPVVLRDVVHDERIPASVRRALSLEAGMNDVIVLPTVLVLAAVAAGEVGGAGEWARFLFELLLLGPALGAVVGVVGAGLMAEVDARRSVRSEWQALYGVGLVLCAFAVGETAGEDGFLAAFAAGAAVSLSNRRMCDCFLDFGEVIAELLMLISFVLFGAALSTELDLVSFGEAALLALIALLLIRPLSLGALLTLRTATLSNHGRAFIAWFGPRGLNSLLLALLVVDAGVPEGGQVFALAGIVVIASTFLHGASATPLSAWYGAQVDAETHPEERELDGLLGPLSADDVPRIDAEDLARRLDSDDPPVVLDVRSRSGYASDPYRIPGAQRVKPEEVQDWAEANERDKLVVLYCT
ncbi:MAG: cation:proton antiporter [Actinomycetota bacterium]|nr:cation:proton antiporter [Actinomycetota bacterium]